MSGTKLALKITEKQRAWANAFLTVMGEDSTIEETDLAKRSTFGRAPNTPLEGQLREVDRTVDEKVSTALTRNRSDIAGEGEDVSRVGGSKDRGYKTKVAEPVDALLEKAGELIAQNKLGPEVDKLVVALREQAKHYYDNLRGEKDDNKRDQRQRKMEAIHSRIEALQQLQTQVGGMQTEREFELHMMSGRERVDALAKNPEILNAVLAKKPSVQNLLDLVGDDNPESEGEIAIADTMAKALSGDKQYMAELAKGLILKQGAREVDSTFFRGRSVANAFATRAVQQDEDSMGFVDHGRAERDVLLGKVAKQKTQADRLCTEYVTTVVDKICNSDVPPVLLSVLMGFAGSAQANGNVNVIGQIKSQLLLKLVVPTIMTGAKQGGKKMGGDETRTATIVGKTLMNIANGTQPRNTTEWADYPLLLGTIVPLGQQINDWAQRVWDDHKTEFGFP